MVSLRQQGELTELTVTCFGAWEFEYFLKNNLEFDVAVEVGGGGLKEIIAKSLGKLDMQGRLSDFAVALALERPRRDDVQRFLREKFPQWVVNDLYKEKRSDAERGLRELDSVRLAPVIHLQRAGGTQTVGALAANGGFQRQLRPHLGFQEGYDWAIQLIKTVRRVCRIEQAGVGSGTGFLVGPDVLLTCYHVLEEAIQGRRRGDTVSLRFDYHLSEGNLREGKVVRLLGDFADWHLDSSAKLDDTAELADTPATRLDSLDHALVRLAEPIGLQPIFAEGPSRGWIRVQEDAPMSALEDPVAIVQHPRGEAAKLAVDTRSVQAVYDTRIRYTTNTDPGSSGSPCFDLKWGLIALHHFGDPNRPPRFNQGIVMNAIRTRLRERKLEHLLGESPP